MPKSGCLQTGICLADFCRKEIDIFQLVELMGGRNIRKLIIYTVPFIGKNCAMPGALKRTPSSSLESVLAKHLISSDGTKSVLIGPELVTYLLSNCCQNDDEGSKSRVSMRFISTPAILSFNASQDLFFNDPLLVFIVLIVFHQLQIAPGAFVRCYSQIAILSGTKDNGVFPNICDKKTLRVIVCPTPGTDFFAFRNSFRRPDVHDTTFFMHDINFVLSIRDWSKSEGLFHRAISFIKENRFVRKFFPPPCVVHHFPSPDMFEFINAFRQTLIRRRRLLI